MLLSRVAVICSIMFALCPAVSFAQTDFPKAASIYKTGSFPLACKSWNGTITEISSADTNRAKITGVVTKEDAQEYCERWAEVTKLGECIQSVRIESRNSLALMSTADCSAGRLRDTKEKEYQLLGIGKFYSHGSFDLLWRHVRSGEILNGSCASGAPPLTGQFKLLCPAVVERLVRPVRNFADEDYWESFWKLDQRGIYDTNSEQFVLSLKNPVEGLRLARSVFQERKNTTATEYTTKRILAWNDLFEFNGKKLFHLELDQDNPRGAAKITRLVVHSPKIKDAAGVTVGNRLVDIPGYNWKKLCAVGEGEVECRSPYSDNVTYTFENGILGEKDTISSIVHQSKVKDITVSWF